MALIAGHATVTDCRSEDFGYFLTETALSKSGSLQLEQIAGLEKSAATYVQNARRFRKGLRRIG